jgi:hypothetical protein
VAADRSLDDAGLADVYRAAERGLQEHQARYPGAPAGRQPVQTLYVPADRFSTATVSEHGREARRLLDAHAPDGSALAHAVGLAMDPALADTVHARVADKLEREPVEDLRVDFEDGYGVRDDAEEDEHARGAATAMAQARSDGVVSPFVGLRVKSFADGLARRCVRTLDAFLTALLAATGGQVPAGLVVTFPKVVTAVHVAAFAAVLARLETALGLPNGSLRFEVQIETTQSILAADGRVALPALMDAADGRLAAAHIGVFDYSSAVGLAPGQQQLDHPALDFARHVLQVAAAGTGVRLSDGSTNAVPATDTAADLHAVWRRHAAHVNHSLRHGFEQGWDLHPAHLVSRYAAVYAFLLDGLDHVVARLRRWTDEQNAENPRASRAPGGILDEPATVRALTRQVRRAVACGALSAREAAARTGLAEEHLW